MNKVLLVYEDDCIGLTVARALGSRGVPLAGIIIGSGGVGVYSKYLKDTVRLGEHNELNAEKLHEVIDRARPAYIMAVGEKDMVCLNRLRPSLPDGVRMLFPDEMVLQKAVMKSNTLRIAGPLGIDCPRTFFADTGDDLEEFLREAHYPVVMKLPYSEPEEIPAPLRMKYKYAYTPEEVREVMDLYTPFGLSPLIQEYVSGKGVGVELCIHKGKVVGAFQHDRIHELPLAGGASTYCRSVELDKDLLDSSARLLREMDWEGVAMVEFRRDPGTGRTALMEVNGRFWGSLFLAVACGVNFPYILYRTMGEGETVEPCSYKIGVSGKREGRELSWAAGSVILRMGLPPEGFPSRLRCLWEFIRTCAPGVKRDMWCWTDLKPGLYFRLKLLPSLVFGLVRWAYRRSAARKFKPG